MNINSINLNAISKKDDPLFDFTSVFSEEYPSASNIGSICIQLMQESESFNEMSGPERKEIVLQVISSFIKESIEDDDEERILLIIAEYTLPPIIDAFIALDKNEMKIHAKKCAKRCFTFACGK
jgi:hypothetical protein